MAADAHAAYLADRAAGKNALLVCDTWEMADALNQRLHDALTVDGPSVGASRDQQIRTGDIIISRHNDARLDVRPAPGHDRVDQVRNGNRWRVAGIDAERGRIAAERAWHAAYERIADTAEHSAERSRSRDQGCGLEL
jgi:hypothetical protein